MRKSNSLKSNSLKSTVALGAAALFALAPVTMRGSNINIIDTNLNDTVTVSAIDFEGGFSVNGVLIQPPGLGIPGSITLQETNQLSFSGQWLDNGQSGIGTNTLYLVEPATPGQPTQVSDVLHYSWASGAGGLATVQGTFVSDFENNLGTLPAGTDPTHVFVENGQAVTFALPFLTGQMLSEVEVVPEPGSLLLAGLGGGLLLLLRFHRRTVLKR